MERKQQNDEIDVFELFRYIKKGGDKIGNAFLRFFNFLMRNIILIGILLLVGIAAGYFLDKATPKHLKTRAVITTNFSSAEYLYNSVKAINTKLSDRNSFFLEKIGAKGIQLSLKIEPVISVREVNNEEENYFELLGENETLSEEEHQAIINKSYEQHQLGLFHTEGVPSEKILTAIVDYIRKNPHYQETHKLLRQSLARQIKSNVYLMAQIDSLLANYSKNIGTNNPGLTYSQNTIDFGNLLNNRLEMQEETRNLQKQLIASSSFLKIVDMDVDQPLEKTVISDHYIVFIPLLLLLLFFLVHILLAINSNAKKLKKSNA